MKVSKHQIESGLLSFYCRLIYFFLYFPIVILVVFSFNRERINAKWTGFTFYWYKILLSDSDLLLSLKNSVVIAFFSTIVSTVLGTCAAFAMHRFRFSGRNFFDAILHLPIIIPDIVMAIALLSFFVLIHLRLGLTSVIIAHITFNIAFVAIVVRARLHDFDIELEEAAMDLGATKFQAFLKITVPLTMPGILAGALLAFTLSFDDFLIAFFTAGVGSTTLPLKVYSMVKFGVSPEINAISAITLLITFILIFIAQKLQRVTTI
ncbi:MAG: ABC transporter permease [Candidatus Hydrogenedentota bacterium]|nr:MAG: ABC transporter permease [Candidatus Hydrogenedentota bacterium]